MTLQLFPALEPAIEQALRASIERFGVLVPVVHDQNGQVIDGHHRAAIATSLGKSYRVDVVEVADEAEALEVARTLNADRRHLEADQRQPLATDLREGGHSLRAIAGALGVDEKTIRNDLAGADHSAPAEVRGLDGKHYPARRVQPGDEVTDDYGEARVIDAVESHGDEVVLHDGSGNALIVDGNKEMRARRFTKPDLGAGVSHPARFSAVLLVLFEQLLDGYPRVLDPFAGTGRIHAIQGHETVGVEIEPEWAGMHPDTMQGDATDLPFEDDSFDAICTSPTYGNRLADHHEASDPSLRRSYRHDLGRPLTEGNSGELHWGDDYRQLHERAWAEAIRVLRPGGRFVLNIKDHIRAGERQYVAGWHVTTLCRMGLDLLWHVEVETPALRVGENAEARESEQVYIFEADK